MRNERDVVAAYGDGSGNTPQHLQPTAGHVVSNTLNTDRCRRCCVVADDDTAPSAFDVTHAMTKLQSPAAGGVYSQLLLPLILE